MAPAQTQTAEPLIPSDKMSPSQENKPPIPSGAGAKKAMEAYFAGANHMEFRQRSSSATRSTRAFSRGATPSRDAANARTGASGGGAEGAIDPDALKNALKKIPSVEKISLRPTPPRSRSISRSNSPLPDEELLDESLPDFYKVVLKPTERTGSQTRDISLGGGGNRLSRGATPTGDASAAPPEFRRVALRRTPSREQLVDERAHRRSTLKKNAVAEASSSTWTNLSRSASFTSLTAINKTVSSRRNSEERKPEFKDVVLKKTGSSSSSRPGSRDGSLTRLEKGGSRAESSSSSSSEGVVLKKVESSSSRRGSATSETTTTEFANVSLKKTETVKGDRSKFRVEGVSLKPIQVGEGEEATDDSSASAGSRREEERASSSSSVSRRRVARETKFEANDQEYVDIKSSLEKLKKKDATPVRERPATPVRERPANKDAEEKEAAVAKEAPPTDDAAADAAAAKPIVYRRRKKLSPEEEEEAEKIHLKPVVKRMSFTSSIECVKRAADEDEEEERKERVAAAAPSTRPLLRKMSFTSSLDNIAVGGEDEREKVHLSCFSKEMGSDVDLVRVCQDRGEEGKHEVKLEFEICGKGEKEGEEEKGGKEEKEERLKGKEDADGETGEKTMRKEREEKVEKDEEEVKLHKMRKAPSIDGLFQRQDVQAAFTFTLPFRSDETNDDNNNNDAKLSLKIPNLS